LRVLPLDQLTLTFPFIENFFGTRASGNWAQTISLPNSRVCSAEFFVTNSRGNSPIGAGAFTSLIGGGLRTLTGGQATLQVPGALAIQDEAVPPLDPGAVYAVRDVYAYVGKMPVGTVGISLQVTIDNILYGTLEIPPGTTDATPIDGATLPPLRPAHKIGLNVRSVGDQVPGSDLTVVIRV
jgi:hypothetical protein